jgi:glycosyltransferase involved in cell wall biosynthesis
MRFGVDATGWTNRRGFGRFTRNAVRRLLERDDEADYVLVVDEATAASDELPSSGNLRVVDTRRPAATAAAAGSSRGLGDILRLTRASRSERLDALLFPSLHTWFPSWGTPSVVGVHDTIADDFPELALPSTRERTFWRAKQRLAVRSASHLFTVSEASRLAVSRRLGLPVDALSVVPEAPDPIFSPRPPELVADARASIDAPDRYLLYAGGISPHKNVVGLVDAYAILVAGLPDSPGLVVAGSLESESFASAAAPLRESIARHGLEARVSLPGHVSDETLARLYSGATVVVNPSLAEGFGLPAVEAAACGAALVLSDLPAHRESLGDAALFVPPGDVPALAAALETMVRDEALRNSLATRATQAVAGRTWDSAADVLASLLREAARR